MKLNWRSNPRDADEEQGCPGLSEQARTRLLGLAFQRLLFGIHAMPIVAIPFAIWMWTLGLDLTAMGGWFAAYALGNVWAVRQRKAFAQDIERRLPEHVLVAWLPRAHVAALVHGFGVGSTMLMTAGQVPASFAYLLLSTVAAIIAGTATHESPEYGTFMRFFSVTWGICMFAIPWLFPHEWPAVLFLAVLYVVAILRHAWSSHLFIVRHVQLEESSQQLAQTCQHATDQAEGALRAKNQFLSTASHDLRQPMHAMGFLIESIAHRNRDAALAAPLDDLRRSVQSMTLMFNSLLDLSRIEGGIVDVRCVPVPIDPLLDEVAGLFREEAHSRGLELRVRPTSSAGTVLADPLLLRQSLVNFTHNALRYTQRGGILLCVRRRGADWRFEVWDTGMGVANEDKAKIHSPFYRNEYAWRIDSAGHGLGLAVVARCAALMHAKHGFDSIEGRGSRFWMQLPAGQPREAAAHALAQRAAPVLPMLAGACLVVEDDPQVAAAWHSLMQAWGVEVRCAASAAEAFAVLAAGFVPQAVLCDQRLRSGESGFDVLKALFARCPDASGAMVSGEFASEELRQAERDGYLVLHKPVEVGQLHALLAQWLQPAHA